MAVRWSATLLVVAMVWAVGLPHIHDTSPGEHVSVHAPDHNCDSHSSESDDSHSPEGDASDCATCLFLSSLGIDIQPDSAVHRSTLEQDEDLLITAEARACRVLDLSSGPARAPPAVS